MTSPKGTRIMEDMVNESHNPGFVPMGHTQNWLKHDADKIGRLTSLNTGTVGRESPTSKGRSGGRCGGGMHHENGYLVTSTTSTKR